MRKYLVMMLAAAVLPQVSAQVQEVQEEWVDKPGVSDRNEPRPPSTVTATNVATVVDTTIEQDGVALESQSFVITKAPTVAVSVNTPQSALPEPKIIAPQVDLAETMSIMQVKFDALQKSIAMEDKNKIAVELLAYAGQAQALGDMMQESMREDFMLGMQQLRLKLAELQASIEAQDEGEIKRLLNEIEALNQKAHEYFNVRP